MARKNWNQQYKTDMLSAYVRILRKHKTSLTATGTDDIANRAHFLHLAQNEVCKDEELRRDITVPFATMFLRQHKGIIEAVRGRVDLQLRQDSIDKGNDPAIPPEGLVIAGDTKPQPLNLLGDNSDKQVEKLDADECCITKNTTHSYPIAVVAMQTIGVLESIESLIRGLRPLTELEFGKLIADIKTAIEQPAGESEPSNTVQEKLVEKVVEKIVYVQEPCAFVNRKPGELRIVFDDKPSVIIAGFQPDLTKNVLTRLKGILPYTRAQYSALMQCLVEHPDASVLILADSITMNPRIDYLTRALEIQVIQVPNTREGLEQAIDHVNGYTVKEPSISKSPSLSKDPGVIEVVSSSGIASNDETSESPTDEQNADPDFTPANRRVVFITHGHNSAERNELRLRFVKYLDIRYCQVPDLEHLLVGHKYPAILHYAQVPPAQAVAVMKQTEATMYYIRSGYMDALGKLAELEAEIQKQ